MDAHNLLRDDRRTRGKRVANSNYPSYYTYLYGTPVTNDKLNISTQVKNGQIFFLTRQDMSNRFGILKTSRFRIRWNLVNWIKSDKMAGSRSLPGTVRTVI